MAPEIITTEITKEQIEEEFGKGRMSCGIPLSTSDRQECLFDPLTGFWEEENGVMCAGAAHLLTGMMSANVSFWNLNGRIIPLLHLLEQTA